MPRNGNRNKRIREATITMLRNEKDGLSADEIRRNLLKDKNFTTSYITNGMIGQILRSKIFFKYKKLSGNTAIWKVLEEE